MLSPGHRRGTSARHHESLTGDLRTEGPVQLGFHPQMFAVCPFQLHFTTVMEGLEPSCFLSLKKIDVETAALAL